MKVAKSNEALQFLDAVLAVVQLRTTGPCYGQRAGFGVARHSTIVPQQESNPRTKPTCKAIHRGLNVSHPRRGYSEVGEATTNLRMRRCRTLRM